MLTVALALEEGAVPCISENDGVLREEVAVVDIVLHQTVRDRFGGSKCRLSIYARTGGGEAIRVIHVPNGATCCQRKTSFASADT